MVALLDLRAFTDFGQPEAGKPAVCVAGRFRGLWPSFCIRFLPVALYFSAYLRLCLAEEFLFSEECSVIILGQSADGIRNE